MREKQKSNKKFQKNYGFRVSGLKAPAADPLSPFFRGEGWGEGAKIDGSGLAGCRLVVGERHVGVLVPRSLDTFIKKRG